MGRRAEACVLSDNDLAGATEGRELKARGRVALSIHCTTVRDMVTNIRKDIRGRAEAKFKKAQIALREGAKARAEYETRALAIRANTARLRSLRLARDADKR